LDRDQDEGLRQASGSAPLLSVRGLTIEFADRRLSVTAVEDVSFDVFPGEVLGLVGESGAGKSVTGNALIGLLDPPGRIAAGEILFEGQRLGSQEEARRIRGRRIGAIFQDPLSSLNPLFTVGQQLVETIRTHLGLGQEEARRRAIHWLKEVGIPAADRRIDQSPHQVSGGMR